MNAWCTAEPRMRVRAKRLAYVLINGPKLTHDFLMRLIRRSEKPLVFVRKGWSAIERQFDDLGPGKEVHPFEGMSIFIERPDCLCQFSIVGLVNDLSNDSIVVPPDTQDP